MDSKEIYQIADQRRQDLGLSYAGALMPLEAAGLLAAVSGGALVDVRTHPELVYVGRVPDAGVVEWQQYPEMQINPNFIEQLRQVADADKPVLFLCRSGGRSDYAAAAAAAAGYKQAFNVLQGFEGDINDEGKRGQINGWRFHGLPWEQS